MTAGTLYVMNLWMAKGDGNPDMQFTIFGTTSCNDLPWHTNECPVGNGDWKVLGQTWVNFPTEGNWQEVTVSFTPTEDIYGVALGSDCTTPPKINQMYYNFYYVDELTLADSEEFKC